MFHVSIFFEGAICKVNKGEYMVSIYLHFQKAFGNVPQGRLSQTIMVDGIGQRDFDLK